MRSEIPRGTVLDNKYLVVRKLGEGGFGEVYLAQDLLLKRRYVAIKSLTLEDAERERYLIREMEFLSSLAHPHIVNFLHHFRGEDILFLVMEYCRGGSLRQALKAKGTFQVEQVAKWGIDLCATLQVVHKNGIVHHDLKPENILFSNEGVIKVADFGVANTRAGTQPYMAPELFLLGENVSRLDGRVDIYALGLTLLEVLMGENPFFALSQEDALNRKVQLDFILGEIPLWFREIILKSLQPKPELRFQTMQEFQEALESKHVPYVFNRKRIQAHKTASKAEWNLNRKKWITALRLTEQALYQDPNCLSALITAGKCGLFLKRIERAEKQFDQALRINPRVSIQKELGWIYLEKGRYSEAISLLNDYLQRHAANYEAYNLLVKAFYNTDRYEAASELNQIILQDFRGNKCFENNLLLSQWLLGRSGEEFMAKVDRRNPFIRYNWEVFSENPRSWDRSGPATLKSKLLFQEFRFGDGKKWKRNVVFIENMKSKKWFFDKPIICFGRHDNNDIVFQEDTVSRRHCVLVNCANDLWLFDLGSTRGTFLDGEKVINSAYLEGRHKISIGDWTLTVLTKEDRLL